MPSIMKSSAPSGALTRFCLRKLNIDTLEKPENGEMLGVSTNINIRAALDKETATCTLFVDMDISCVPEKLYRISLSSEADYLFSESTTKDEMEIFLQEHGQTQIIDMLRFEIDAITASFPYKAMSLPPFTDESLVNVSF